jgi:RHS repeat-associated protein
VVSSGNYAVANPWRFSTKPVDAETGYSYYGYRYYNPVTGRFINRDPIEEQGGANLYGFCYNNSISMFDTLGDSPKSVINTWQDAKEHWQSGAGGSVSAGSTLMATIKNSSGCKRGQA